MAKCNQLKSLPFKGLIVRRKIDDVLPGRMLSSVEDEDSSRIMQPPAASSLSLSTDCYISQL